MTLQDVTANLMAFDLLKFVLFGFMNNLASHLERSPLIHSYGYDYDGHPALALRARFAHANLLPANLSAGDRPTCLASLPLNSKSFMQYAG